jgi:hypothetical protein
MSRVNGSSYASKLMGRVAETGDGSTLSLDFTTMGGTIDSRITFSRADATARATFINSLGYVETVPVGQPQAPRFTFSETSIGTPRGLLLEAPATNLHLYSIGLSQYPWSVAANVVRTLNTGGTAPDGTNNTASRISMTGAITASSALYYDGIVVTNQTYTHSVYAKANGADWLYLWIETSGGTANGAYFNLTGSGSVGNLVGSGTTARITPCLNGWYRCETTSTQPAGTTYPVMLPSTANLTGRLSMVGTTPGNVFVWGDQLEAGSLASSYLFTVASTVTRAVDTAIIAAGSNFSSWYTGGTTGTFVTEWCRCSPTTTQRTVIATSDVSNQHLHQYIAATTSRLRLADKVPAFIETANASVDNSINKGAFSYSGSVQSLCLNGGTVVAGTLTFTTAPTWLSIGGPSTNGTSITDTAVVLNNAIRKIKYFPTRLSDGQIQGLTTL